MQTEHAIEIPKHLRTKNNRFIRLGRKGKIPIDPAWGLDEAHWKQLPNKSWKHRTEGKIYRTKDGIYYGPIRNYAWNDPIITEWIATGNNYGVLGGFANLIGFDADDHRLQKIYEDNFKDTFTVKSGGTNKDPEHPTKLHYYIQGDEALTKTIPLCDYAVKDNPNLGHLRWFAGQLVGPTCNHPEGTIYKIVKDVPVLKVETKKLLKVLGKYIKGDSVRTKIPQQKTDSSKNATVKEQKNAFAGLQMSILVDLSKLTDRGNGEYQGPHPLHLSTTGWDCTINTNKNTWRCFGHNSGGGVGEFIAVKHKLMECADCQKGELRGELFKKVRLLAINKYGLKNDDRPEIKEVPTSDLINFSEFDPIFENTHQHLHAFELISTELGLIGKEFYPIKKFLCYDIESQRQETIGFFVGRERFDNRAHSLFVGGGGRGKGTIKTLSKLGNNYAELSASRTNIEQLVGKKRKVKGEDGKTKYITDKSYFGKKKLNIDEGQAMLKEDDKGSAAIMHDFRQAMDIFGYNELDKKQVDADWHRFCPETRISIFTHDIILPPLFFDTGTYRRLFAFELKPQKVSENTATANLYRESRTQEFKDYIREPAPIVNDLVFTKDCIDIAAKYIKIWNRFVLQHPSQRIRTIAKQGFFSVKQYYFRIIAILSIQKNQKIVTKKTVQQACFDCTQFLLETFELYANKSEVKLSRDVWRTDELFEARLFEWMHFNQAYNREATPISIYNVQEQIGEIWGCNDRQAQSHYKRLKSNGLINSKKGQHDSKAWLNFKPELEGFVEFDEENLPGLKTFLITQKNERCER